MTSFTTLTPHASLDIDLDRFLELVRADMVGNMKGLTGANSSGNEKDRYAASGPYLYEPAVIPTLIHRMSMSSVDTDSSRYSLQIEAESGSFEAPAECRGMRVHLSRFERDYKAALERAGSSPRPRHLIQSGVASGSPIHRGHNGTSMPSQPVQGGLMLREETQRGVEEGIPTEGHFWSDVEWPVPHHLRENMSFSAPTSPSLQRRPAVRRRGVSRKTKPQDTTSDLEQSCSDLLANIQKQIDDLEDESNLGSGSSPLHSPNGEHAPVGLGLGYRPTPTSLSLRRNSDLQIHPSSSSKNSPILFQAMNSPIEGTFGDMLYAGPTTTTTATTTALPRTLKRDIFPPTPSNTQPTTPTRDTMESGPAVNDAQMEPPGQPSLPVLQNDRLQARSAKRSATFPFLRADISQNRINEFEPEQRPKTRTPSWLFTRNGNKASSRSVSAEQQPTIGVPYENNPIPHADALPLADAPPLSLSLLNSRSKIPETGYTLQCVVCFEEWDISVMIQIPQCMDLYCRGCITELFKRALFTPRTQCPVKCCRSEVPISLVSAFLTPQEIYKYTLSRLENKTINKTYCSKLTCGAFIPPTRVQFGVATCTECGHRTCNHCKREKHSGACPKDKETAKVLAVGKKNSWARCEQCQHLIERIDGCLHITCICMYEFCYSCEKVWKDCAGRCMRR